MKTKRGWLAEIADICNSDLAKGISAALIILALLLGMGGCIYLEHAGRAELRRNEQ